MSERITPLYARDDRDKTPFLKLLTRELWVEAMVQFPVAVRHHAANLAAHNWDVTMIGERLLISCPWSGGHWVSKDGTRAEISDAEWDAFYPILRKDMSTFEGRMAWGNATQTTGGRRRSLDLVLPTPQAKP